MTRPAALPVLFAVAIALTVLPFSIAQPVRESTFLQLGRGKRITIEYTRPSSGGKAMIGQSIPYGKVWGLGGAIPAKLTTEVDLGAGETLVTEGTYSLFLIPNEKSWKLIVNNAFKPEGVTYDEKQDAARFDMEVEPAAKPVDQLTVSLIAAGGGRGKLNIAWENQSATFTFNTLSY